MTGEVHAAALVDLLIRASARIQGALDRSAAACGVSPTQARMLSALSGGAPTMKELAAHLGLDKSSTSGLIDRAQLRGLVRRVPSQRDRRSIRVRLTGPGRELAAEIDSLVAGELAALLEPLAAGERSALANALGQLSAAGHSA